MEAYRSGGKQTMSEAIVITSGKGGVGKTTTVANIGTGLAMLGRKVVVVDTDIGLRNLDVVLGLENRIVYNLVDVIGGNCRLRQRCVRDHSRVCGVCSPGRQGGALWHLPCYEPAGLLGMGAAAAVAARAGADTSVAGKPAIARCYFSVLGTDATLGTAAGAGCFHLAGPACGADVPPAAGCRHGGGSLSWRTTLQRIQKLL